MNETDRRLLQRAIEIAGSARANGNHPFGALLVDDRANVLLEAENTVVTGRDCTGHAETNLVRLASRSYEGDFLAKCTLYTSTEPCPMCAGAMFWANIGRVLYALGQERLYELIGESDEASTLLLSVREIFAAGNRQIEIAGPALEHEAAKAHLGFWT